MQFTDGWRKAVAVSATALVLTGVWAGTASADTLDSGSFEGFAVGDINGQHGWTKTNANYDVHIVDPSDAAFGRTDMGTRALRVSNAVASGSFGDHTFSAPNAAEAGETAAANDGKSGGTRQRHFETAFTFTSASPAEEQAGLTVGISPDRGDGARMSLVRVYDKAQGLKVTVLDSDTNAAFTEHTVAEGLSRAGLHSLHLAMDFADGKNNDLVTVSVDDASPVTVGSWENYYNYDNPATEEIESVPTRTVDSLLIRPTLPAQPALAGKGLLIDGLATTTVDAASTEGNLGGCDVSVDAVTSTITLLDDCNTSEGLDIGGGWTLDGAGNTITAVDPANGAFSGDVVSVMGGDVAIRDLHVRSASEAANSGGTFNGIRFLNAGGSVVDSTVMGITHGNGVQEGRGIVVDNRGGSEQRSVVLDTVEVQRYQKSGVISYGDVDLTVRDSIVGSAATADGGSMASQIAANAVTMVGGTAEITGSHISGNEWNGNDAATAVLALDGASVKLANNVIDGRNTDVGVYASDAAVDMTCNMVLRTVSQDDPQDAYGVGLLGEDGGSVDSTGTTFGGWHKAIRGGVTVQPVNSECAPAAPQHVTVSGGLGEATISWDDAEVPSAPVTKYVVSAPGIASVTVSGSARSAKLTGLVSGRGYVFTVQASNAWGDTSTSTDSVDGTAVTAALSKSTVVYGSATTVQGTLLADGAGLAGAPVQALVRKAGSATWTVAATATTTPTGTFAMPVTPAGASDIKVRYAGGSAALGSESAAKQVRVRTSVTAALSKTTAAKGAKVSLTGKVAPSHAGKKVSLQKQVAKGVWVTVAKARLDSASKYSFRLSTTKSGTSTYRVFKAADVHHADGWSVKQTLRVR